ncbi:sugar-binding of ABC transporter system related protein, putative [Babesia ovis]|uniref:Sugar-binding of ABC transporter system related protein, putative n=1 Tax=Babesia ovis TaxID=5869 RepID=A0A9W5WWJ7_BABOV|nr:sugar-binding of ABC transporter system related protein, putative [Babesia ovis]
MLAKLVETGCLTEAKKTSVCGHVFSREHLDDGIQRLLAPGEFSTTTDAYRPKRQRDEQIGCFRGVLPFDRDEVITAYPSIVAPIVPRNGDLEFVNESLELLKGSMCKIPGFQLNNGLENVDLSDDGPEGYFTKLVDNFFDYLDHLDIPDIGVGSENLCQSNRQEKTKINTSNDHDRSLFRVLLQCHVLWYNWVLQLKATAETALGLIESTLTRSDAKKVLKTALGLKEANRNMVFYSTLCVQLRSLLRKRESTLNKVIWELLSRMHFLGHIGACQEDDDTAPWLRMAEQLSQELNDPPVYDDAEQFKQNLKRIRREMQSRIRAKGQCDAVSKECDYAAQEQTALNGRKMTLATKLEQTSKVVQDLVSAHRTDIQVDTLKIADAKKLPALVHHFAGRLQLHGLKNPNREIGLKVVKDREREYSLVVALSVPRDMLMPNPDIASRIFPLNFRVTLCEKGGLKVKQPNCPFNILPMGDIAKREAGDNGDVSSVSASEESSPEADINHTTLGLHNFNLNDRFLPQVFCDRLDWWYNLSNNYMWNTYCIENYRRNRLDVKQFLPSELRKDRCSKYEYKTPILLLSNDSASIKLRLQIDSNQRPSCRFNDFEWTTKLALKEMTPLMERVANKNKQAIDKAEVCELLETVDEDIWSHFGADYQNIQVAVLLESYAFIFDWISSHEFA